MHVENIQTPHKKTEDLSTVTVICSNIEIQQMSLFYFFSLFTFYILSDDLISKRICIYMKVKSQILKVSFWSNFQS